MRVLLIAPTQGFSSKDAGYGNASASFVTIFSMMMSQKTISKLTIVNTLEQISKENLDNADEFDIGFLVVNPFSLLNPIDKELLYHLMRNCKRKFLNILWETLPLPRAWSFLFDDSTFFDGFVASSYFIGNQLLNLTKKKVYYFPIYVDFSKYTLTDLEIKKQEEKFTVLFVGQNTKRKGVEDSIIAYSRALGVTKDSRLVMKYHLLSDIEFSVEDLIKCCAQTNMECKNTSIYTINKELTSEEMVTLYKSVSVLLFLSRGEGFGLPAVESMLCGIPVVYTNWSSSAEVAKSPVNYSVKYVLDEAHSMYHHNYEYGSYYGVPLIRDSIVGLASLYKLWKEDKEAYYIKAQGNRDIILERFSVQKIIQCFEHIFEDKEGFCPKELYDEILMKRLQSQWNEYVR
jgi:glycosyltransferase involved in cell wall biosynthesis